MIREQQQVRLDGASPMRVVGYETNSSSSLPVLPYHRIGCSQDTFRSYPASQPSISTSIEEASMDGGRAHIRFQDFVSRTRHAELLDTINELKLKIMAMEERLTVALKNGSMCEVSGEDIQRQILDSLMALSSDHSIRTAIANMTEAITSQLKAHASKIDNICEAWHTKPFYPTSVANRSQEYMHQVVDSENHARSSTLEDESDNEDELMPLTQYMASRSAKVRIVLL